jgi:hypothetical protein
MAKHTVVQAAKLVGKSRNIIYTAIKAGKLSAEPNREGNTVIDTAELLRHFGAFTENSAEDNVVNSLDIVQNKQTKHQKQAQQHQPDTATHALLLELGELRAAKEYLVQIAKDAKERAELAESRLDAALSLNQKLLVDLQKAAKRKK